MEKQQLTGKITETVEKKVDLIEKSPMRYLVRAMLAALYLTLASTISYLVAEALHRFLLLVVGNTPESVGITFAIAKIGFSMVFGWALVYITYLNGELFTSNAMYFSGKLFSKGVKLKPAVKVLVLCFIGNLIGAVLSSFLMSASGTFPAEQTAFAQTVVAAKLAKTPMEIFLQGIIANLIINMSVLLIFNLKEDISRIFATLALVFMFAYFGSEHVIANMASFALVGFSAGFQTLPLAPLLTNIVFSTLGNLVGGGLIVGVTYFWLNGMETKYKD